MKLRDEIFVTEVESKRYLVYIPSQLLAFVANAPLVNALVDLKEEADITGISPDVISFLRSLSVIGPDRSENEVSNQLAPPALVLITNAGKYHHGDIRFLPEGCDARIRTKNGAANPDEDAIGAIELVAAYSNEVRAAGFTIYICISESSPDINALLRSIHLHAERITGESGLEVSIDVVVSSPLQAPTLEWVIAHCRTTIFLVPILPRDKAQQGRIPNAGASTDVQSWRDMMCAYDKSGSRYEVSIDVRAEDVAFLSSSIRYLFGKHGVQKVVLDASFLNQAVSHRESSLTTRFIEEFKRTQRVASICGREVSFVGAALLRRSNFAGQSANSWQLLPNGQVLAYSIPRSYRAYRAGTQKNQIVVDVPGNDNWAYCSGCMAKHNCLGPEQNEGGDYSDEQYFNGYKRCRVVREVIKDQIIERIAASGGMVWNGRVTGDPESVTAA